MQNSSPKVAEKEVQTDAIKSLPCSVCISSDVNVHPAVAAGIVNVELASVFIPECVPQSSGTKSRVSRRCDKGRCITSETELAKMREKRQNEIEKEEMKQRKMAERDQKRIEKENIIRAKQAAREQKEQHKQQIDAATENAKSCKISRGKCNNCQSNVPKSDRAFCALCSITFHKQPE